MAGRGYGTSDYGQSLYGQTLYLDGVATVSASATPSATCNRVALADSSIAATASVSSPTGEFMIDAAANTIQGTSSVASAAVEVFDGLASGGGSAAGSIASGTRIREASATAAASASNTASLQFITNASGSTAASASVAISYERVRLVAPTVNGQCTFTATANYDVIASSTITGAASLDNVNWIRERNAESNVVQGTGSFASTNGREKWESITTGSQSWDTISQTSITWSEIAA